MKRILLALALGATLASGVAIAQGESDEPAHEDALIDWTVAFNTTNAAALGALYTENAQLYLHGRPRIEGRAEIQALWAGDMGLEPMIVLTATHAAEGPDNLFVQGSFQILERTTGLLVGAGSFAHIWLMMADGRWLLDRDVWYESEDSETSIAALLRRIANLLPGPLTPEGAAVLERTLDVSF